MPSQQSTIAFYRDIPYILISKLFGKKVILHLRGANFLNWYNDCNNLVKFTVRQTQKIINGQIVLGNNLRYLFTQFMPEEKIFVIPNGAKLNYKDRITNKSKINISFLGNYTRTKGIIDFIKSTTLLSEDYYDQINFQMAGHWREKDCEIETKLLLNDNREVPINNMGPMIGKNKLKYLYNSDIFVYPTLNDGHPWVIVEAMAAGLPIISTDQGAIVESVIDGKNGFIVEKNNPEQIAKKIQFLIDNPKIRIEMGKKSREMYLNKFTEEKLVENFKNVFNNVLNN
jgi:glycosyltransferase involved in cell wall biosynthesis